LTWVCSLTLLFISGLFAAGAIGHALPAALAGSAGVIATTRTAGNSRRILLAVLLLTVRLLAVLRLAILLLTFLQLPVLRLPILPLAVLLHTILRCFVRHGFVGLRTVLRLHPITAGIGIATIRATLIIWLRPLRIALAGCRAC
jgi:hypothetical protein